jgi:hypothetical protein
MVEILAAERIATAEKGTADAAIDAVVASHRIFFKDFAPGRSGHGTAPCRGRSSLQEQAPNAHPNHHRIWKKWMAHQVPNLV